MELINEIIEKEEIKKKCLQKRRQALEVRNLNDEYCKREIEACDMKINEI